MSGRVWTVFLVAVFVIALPGIAGAQDSPETLIEQQRARDAEAAGPQSRVGVMHPDSENTRGADGLLFIGVDDATVSTYSVDPIDNTTTPQFLGFDVWGAAMIPAALPGDAVVYFNDGSSLYRWPANGVPELCCTLTYQAATTSVVSVAYDLGRCEAAFHEEHQRRSGVRSAGGGGQLSGGVRHDAGDRLRRDRRHRWARS